MNLASFELLGDADLLNQETAKYLAVTPAQIKEAANKIFRKDNSSTLIYLAEKAEVSESEFSELEN
jgi:predicted Zn-dependent peptidase